LFIDKLPVTPHLKDDPAAVEGRSCCSHDRTVGKGRDIKGTYRDLLAITSTP
jgi:hypothetical protein